jgi:hypothetical protein
MRGTDRLRLCGIIREPFLQSAKFLIEYIQSLL